MRNKEKIIVVEKRRGCGCGGFLALLLVGACAFFYFCVPSPSEISSGEHPPRTRSHAKVDQTAQPSNIELDLIISNTMRRELNDPSSYSPIGTRIARHPEGFAYVHEFRAKNAFGAIIKDSWGFLYSTNSASWTFYTRDDLPALLKDITIDPDLVK